MDVAEQRVAILEDDKVAEVTSSGPRAGRSREHLQGHRRQRPPGMEAAFVEIGLEKRTGSSTSTRSSPSSRTQARPQDPGPAEPWRGDPRPGRQDPMKSKGTPDDRDLAARPVRRLRPERRGLRRLAPAARGGAHPPPGHPEVGRTEVRGMIVRTAAEERPPRTSSATSTSSSASGKRSRDGPSQDPALVYQEAELPLRVVRDLFTNDFEQAGRRPRPDLQADRRLPEEDLSHMAEKSGSTPARRRSSRTSASTRRSARPLAPRRPSLRRLPRLRLRGGVHGHRREHRPLRRLAVEVVGRLEDTITKNNLEAVKEVVRQLRLRDIGGIIVIDFIDMANRRTGPVEEALKTELERDRTKTYVVEISPLGLVEMTRQNVSHGPREILTKRCRRPARATASSSRRSPPPSKRSASCGCSRRARAVPPSASS